MVAPKRTLFIGPEGSQTKIDLVGQILACIAYEEVADGSSLEELAFDLAPTAERTGDQVRVKTDRLSSQAVLDLLYALSAGWRDSSGWNSRYTREGDPMRPPRERARYIELAKLLPVSEKRRVSSILLALLIETVFPPGGTATETEPSPR